MDLGRKILNGYITIIYNFFTPFFVYFARVYNGNALKRIKVKSEKKKKEKSQKQPKRNPKEDTSIQISSRIDTKSVEDSVKEIKDSYLNDSFQNISNIFADFLQKCVQHLQEKERVLPQKHLREATLYLIIKIRHSFNDDTDISDVLEQIVIGYQNLLKENENDKKFLKGLFDGLVANDVWFKSTRDVLKLDVSKYSDVLDQLFHLSKFDNNKKQNFAYFHVRKMLYDQETFANAIEWIMMFGLDLEKLKDKGNTRTKENYFEDAKKPKWMEMVEKTAKDLHHYYSCNSIRGQLACIDEFYSKCSKEWLRSATMYLIYCTFLSLSKIEYSDPSLIISEIILGFDAFLKKNGKRFSEDVIFAKVSDDLWNESFKVAFSLRCAVFRKKCAIFRKDSAAVAENDSLEILPSFDLLFKVRHPENEKRKRLILENIRELLGNEKTLNFGVDRVHALKINLESLKIRITAVGFGNDDQPCTFCAEKIIDIFQKYNYVLKNCISVLNLFYNDPTDERLSNPEWVAKLVEQNSDVNIYVKSCPLKLVRSATMKLLLMIDSTKETSTDLIFEICKRYYTCVHASNRNKIATVNVPDELWLNAFKICFGNPKLRCLNSSPHFETLFSINQPETNDRKDIIYDCVLGILSKNETFHTAITWINKFNMEKLKEEQFGHVHIYSYLFENGGQTLEYMDGLLKQLSTDTLPTVLRKAEKKEITCEKLLNKICKYAEKQEIDLEAGNYYAFKASFIQKTKIKFEYLDRLYFEVYALEDVKPREYKYKVWFLRSILSDKSYAYCWAKYFEIKDLDIPKELTPCAIYISEGDLLKFKNEIEKRVHIPVCKDHEEMCKFWGRSYKLITIFSPEALQQFAQEYFIESKPKLIGIDIETGKDEEAATLQLATSEWTCLIKIQELFDQLTEDQWITFFKLLFDPKITRVGFAFQHDFKFLCNKFPYLHELLQQKESRVLCLQKLAKQIIKLIDEHNIVEYFCTEIYAEFGLAKLTKAVLYLNMDKSEQKSDWTKNMLTQFQKCYAVSDAVIVVLVKDEMQKRLERDFPAEKVEEIMGIGYICYEKAETLKPENPNPSPASSDCD